MKHPIKTAIIFALLCLACAFIIIAVEQHFKPEGNGFVQYGAFEIVSASAGNTEWQTNSPRSNS